MRVFLYARVSMDNVNDEREQNPEAQLNPLRAHCRADGWEVVGEFVDRESGSSYLRPQFRDMIQRLMKGEADCVYVWKLDRLSRFKALETLILINELKKRNIAIKSNMETWADTTTPNNISSLLLFITAWIAEQERANTSIRTKAGIAAKKAKGEWKGGRPKGSKDKVVRRERRWEVKPELEIQDLFSRKSE